MRPLKWYRELSTPKGRHNNGCFLIEGKRSVLQLSTAYPEAVEELLVDETDDIPDFGSFRLRQLSGAQFRSITSSATPQGIMACVRIPAATYTPELPARPGERIIILEHVQDPGNVGTLIRTAAAFNFNGIIMSEQSADPFSPKVVQATAGAILHPWIRRTPDYMDMVKNLQNQNYRLLGADIHGDPHLDFSEMNRIAIAFGNEGNGLSPSLQKAADMLFAVPFNASAVESLNVAVTGAIVLFAASQKNVW